MAIMAALAEASVLLCALVSVAKCQLDCVGVACPVLDDCIQEVQEPGACCPACAQRGCTCEGYQYYDCVGAGFQDGKVPEGAAYFVDYGSTECSCPRGGGPISCSFISCPELPPNCVQASQPPDDGCPHCERLGCLHGEHKYDAGSSFHVQPCRVCHCPLLGGMLMCYPVPDCDPLHTGTPMLAQNLDQDLHQDPLDLLQFFKPPLLHQGELEDYDYDPTEFPQATPTPQAPPTVSSDNVYRTWTLPSEDVMELKETDGADWTESPITAQQDLLSQEGGTESPKQLDTPSSVSPGFDGVQTWASVPPEVSGPPQNQTLAVDISHERSQRTEGDGGAEEPDDGSSEEQEDRVSTPEDEDVTTPQSSTVSSWLGHTLSTTIVLSTAVPTSSGDGTDQDHTTVRLHGEDHNRTREEATQQTGSRWTPEETWTTAETVQRCCAVGQSWASEHNSCELQLQRGDESTCSLAQTQCCLSSLRERRCLRGVASARGGRVCQVDGDNCDNTHQVCCSCCTLGLRVGAEGRGCHAHRQLGRLCGHAFLACCEKEEEEAGLRKPRATPTAAPTRVSPEEANLITDEENFVVVPTPKRTLTLPDPCEGRGGCSHRCRAVGGHPVCSCFPGFSLRDDGRSCEDIDECRLQTHRCGSDSACQNTVGSFLCRQKCLNGFTQDAHGNCVDINECASRMGGDPLGGDLCPLGFNCINTVGSFSCQRRGIQCGAGYHADADGAECVDIDECRLGEHRCGPDQVCQNVPGTYRCHCQTGYQYDARRRTCTDVDECRRFPERPCSQKCENTVGSYRCSCTTGYILAADAKTCQDVDECKSSPCSQHCANVQGSYQCYCSPGYYLREDGHTCEDIDECAQSTGNLCSFRCVNVAGSYKCACPPRGFVLSPNGRTCKDVDECSTNTHNCSLGLTCYNIHGGFRCLSLSCPHYYRRTSDSRCERLPCPPGSSECLNSPLRITFYQLSFQTNIIVPAQIFRIGPSPAYAGDHVSVAITRGNEDAYFGVRMLNGFTGSVFLQRQVQRPRDFALDVEMKLRRHGTLSTFLSRIHVFITSSSEV